MGKEEGKEMNYRRKNSKLEVQNGKYRSGDWFGAGKVGWGPM